MCPALEDEKMTHVPDEDDQRDDDESDVNADSRLPRPLAQMAVSGEEKNASGSDDDEDYRTDQHGGQLLTRIEATLRGHLPAQERTSADGHAKPESVISIPMRDLTHVFEKSLSREDQEENQRDPDHDQTDRAMQCARISGAKDRFQRVQSTDDGDPSGPPFLYVILAPGASNGWDLGNRYLAHA